MNTRADLSARKRSASEYFKMKKLQKNSFDLEDIPEQKIPYETYVCPDNPDQDSNIIIIDFAEMRKLYGLICRYRSGTGFYDRIIGKFVRRNDTVCDVAINVPGPFCVKRYADGLYQDLLERKIYESLRG